MKRILCMLLVLVMVLALAACGAAKKDDAAEGANTEISGTLTLTHHRTDLEPQVTALVEDFMKEYPNITIDLEFLADYESTIGIRFTGGEAPDLCELGFSLFPKENWAEYLMPQDDSPLKGNVACGDMYAIDGVYYGYPEDVTYNGFMYNKVLWKDAGIESVPTTMEELIDDLQKLKDSGVEIPLTSMYKTGWAVGLWFGSYVSSHFEGGCVQNFMAANDDPFSDPAVANTLNGFRTMYQKGLLDPDLMSSDWDLQAADFAAGNIGTYLIGSYANGTMTALDFPAEDIGFFAMPDSSGSGECRTLVGGDYALVIKKDCEYPEAAKAFVEYYTRHFADACGMVSPMTDVECAISSVNGMLAENPTVIATDPANEDFTEINKIATFSNGPFVQEYIVADDPQTVIDAYNATWNAARAEYFG